MSNWRYIAQRALTGEFLDMELPLSRDELRWDLSGPGSLRGTMQPDTGALRADDGRLILEEWGTLLYAEADGEIRWGGIVVASGFDGAAWKVECAGFSTYPFGLPFTGEYYGVEEDPADIVRMLWAHVQQPANGNLGVTVAGATPVRLGTHSDEIAAAAATTYAAEKDTYDTLNAKATDDRNQLTAARKIYSDKVAARTEANKALTEAKKTGVGIDDAQAAVDAANDAVDAQDDIVKSLSATLDAQQALVDDAKKTMDKAADDSRAAADAARADGGAYDLAWWDSPDCGREIDALAQQAPFDYTERHFWAPDGPVDDGTVAGELWDWLLTHGWTGKPDDGLERLYPPADGPVTLADADAELAKNLLAWGWTGHPDDGVERLYPPQVAHVVHVHHPRAGRRRTDLSFIQGDNITAVVTPQSDGADFANEVLGLGAGEGAKSVRAVTAVNDGRLRRAHVFAAKDVGSSTRLNTLVADELRRRQNTLQIDSITVTDHPNARIGSWEVGDDILVQATIPWLGDVTQWCRITDWALLTETTAKLTLARSDSFTYGG